MSAFRNEAERLANWFTVALDNRDWRPNRGHIENARNVLRATASAIPPAGAANEPVAWQPEGGKWQLRQGWEVISRAKIETGWAIVARVPDNLLRVPGWDFDLHVEPNGRYRPNHNYDVVSAPEASPAPPSSQVEQAPAKKPYVEYGDKPGEYHGLMKPKPSQAPVGTDAALNFIPPQGAGGRDAAGTAEAEPTLTRADVRREWLALMREYDPIYEEEIKRAGYYQSIGFEARARTLSRMEAGK